MSRIISKAELSRWAGVSRAAVTKACKTFLAEAASDKGVDVDHALARGWLREHGVDTLPDPPAVKSKPRAAKPKPRAAKQKPQKPAKNAPQVTHKAAPAESIHDLDHLENLTVREVVMQYGSIEGFKRFVDSLKSISDYKYKELRARQQRGELVDRDKVAGIVFPMIDVAFSRLVTDVPAAASKAVVARVQSGGPDTNTDVLKIIRDANSKVLKDLKQSALSLEILNDAS